MKIFLKNVFFKNFKKKANILSFNKMTAETMTAQSSGSTKAELCFRARSFQFTLNQVDKYDELKSLLTNLKTLDYLISCEEIAPTTGHKHIHIYTHFNQTYRLSKKIINIGAHIEICKGSPQENIQYIRKDGNILDEIGKEPHQGFHTVKDLQNIDNPEDLNWNEYNTWSKIKNAPKKIKKGEWSKDIKVYWIQGDSGIGKSNWAEDLFNKSDFNEMDEISFDKNGFYNGVVDGKGLCIYDDFRDSDMKASEFIKLIDYRVHNLNIKGGSIKNNYNMIIFTSIQKLENIYSNCKEEQKKQWLRRIEVIDLYKTQKNIDIFNTPIEEDLLDSSYFD